MPNAAKPGKTFAIRVFMICLSFKGNLCLQGLECTSIFKTVLEARKSCVGLFAIAF
jgi:hypothetical protein